MTTASEIIAIFRQDLLDHAAQQEFPVTSMSETLALSTELICRNLAREVFFGDALDFGAGCGIQANIMSLNTSYSVTAIDACSSAVQYAESRFRRVLDQTKNMKRARQVSFRQGTFDDIPKVPAFDLITTNPPGYFATHPPRTPLEWGMFEPKCEVTDSFLYRFMNEVVGPALRENGVLICTWPALRSFLIRNGSALVHPADLLEHWLNWSIIGERRATEDFYEHTARAKYELDQDSTSEFLSTLHSPDYENSLRVDVRNGAIEFNYGILALRRISRDNDFIILDQDFRREPL